MSAHSIKMQRGILEKNISLARFTSWKVGGTADILYRPADLMDLRDFLTTLDKTIPITWLGQGTNVLVRDGGIRGVVILLHGCFNQLNHLERTMIQVEVGTSCAKLARFSADKNLVGAEFMAGIPGTVGGALAMNSGAYGSETWEFVVHVETIDRSGQLHKRTSKDLCVGYRSVEGLEDEWFVSAQFKFSVGDGRQAHNKIHELINKRNASQPVGSQSCGSVFRNPDSDHAARLIELCDLKGVTVGGAQVSTKHANFIINSGNATAKDIEELILKVCVTIEKECSVTLVPEVKIIGEVA
jgi:UDP-N-acetylmuramate dehydrogenase